MSRIMDRIMLPVGAVAAVSAALAGSWLLGIAPAHAATDTVTCQQEDGNPDGTPCVWVDPDTGRQFYNDSANYGGPVGPDLTFCPSDGVWSRTWHACQTWEGQR